MGISYTPRGLVKSVKEHGPKNFYTATINFSSRRDKQTEGPTDRLIVDGLWPNISVILHAA
jgi:hypothetical protein